MDPNPFVLADNTADSHFRYRYKHRCGKTLKQIKKIARKQEKEMTKASKRRRQSERQRRALNSGSSSSSSAKCSKSRTSSSSMSLSGGVSSSSSDVSIPVKEETEYYLRNKGACHTLNDLRGIDSIQEQILERIVWPFSSPRKANILNIFPPRGLLLIGRPGTGKTVLAEAIVHEIRRNGVNVKYYQETGSCLSKYVGESEKRLRDLFRLAKDTAPSVIFFDEVDGLGGKRKGSGGGNSSCSSTNTVLNTLLSEINTVRRGSVLLIAATNCPQHCDPALIRKGRFDITINIPLPNPEARKQILQHYFDKNEVDLNEADLNRSKEETEGFTGSDLEYLAETVHFNLVRKAFPQGSYRNMSRKEIRDKKMELLTNNVEYRKDVQGVIQEMKETRKGIAEWQDEDEQ